MLMPILTVKTAAVTAQAAAVVETVTPKERLPAQPVRISGNQSEAVLKILETLNRHLVGSEPLPKEALIRLLDTLAKILKFPPLPQETLRDFTKRLAVFLETLPPATRLALEKQLGQHNLAVSIRILAEALKGPSIIDASRLPDKFFTPTAVARPVASQPDGKPAVALPIPQGQNAVSGHPAPQVLATIADAGLLQAALKKAFGDEEEIAATAAVADEGEAGPAMQSGGDEQTTKSQTPRSSGMTAAGPQQSGKPNSETIPLLRAAAAFLATDPEALSQVTAIATGDMDSRLTVELGQELGLDLPGETELIEPSGRHDEAEHSAKGGQGSRGENTPASRQAAIDPRTATVPAIERQVQTVPAAGKAALPNFAEVDGFKGHDLGEWELESDNHTFTPAAEAQPATSEAETQQTEKTLAQTLKALVEASLPLPDGSVDPETLFAVLAGETADMGAETLFAQLEASDDAVVPDTAVLTGDVVEQSELEADSWSALLDTPEEKAGTRPAFTSPSTIDDTAREAQMPRPPETGIARDAIPFAMIPYLPAKTEDVHGLKAEEEEHPSFAEDDKEQDEHGESGGQPDDREAHSAAPQIESEEEQAETADAYDLYKRMGGLG